MRTIQDKGHTIDTVCPDLSAPVFPNGRAAPIRMIKDIADEEEGFAPVAFFVLVFALSLPFWLVGAIIGRELMPGLPVSSLMVVCPALAAFILRWRKLGRRRAIAFLSRAVDVWRLRAPAVIALLLLANPGVSAATYLIQMATGVDLPAPDIRLGPTLVLLAIFLVAATGEELGWTGQALEPLQRRLGMVQAGIVIGLVGAAWHFVALGQADRSIEWVMWWTLGAVATRVLMAWFYNHTGQSVFALSVYHAISNVCWQTYPVQGSYFDPQINALVTVALVIVVVRPWSARRRTA